MIKRIAATLFGLLLLIGVLIAVKALQIKDLIAAGESMRPPAIAVATATADTANWESTLSAIGTLEAAQGVIITADAPGRVSALHFDGGETVEAGELLIEQDVSTELAQLSAAESDLKLASSNLDRVSRLYQSKVVSRSEYDSARSRFSAASAQVDNINTSLTKKRIVAPFSGRLGLRLVDIGQDLTGGVQVVSLQATSPMRVNFALPQQALADVRTGLKVRVTSDAVPDDIFEGAITAIDTMVNTSNRTVQIQATLEVPEDSDEPSQLLPGMFASVEVVLPATTPVLMVPVTSISFATFGDSVFVVETNEQDALVVRQQFVQLGERRGDFVAIRKGLEAGQQVVSDGVFKLRNGASIVINEDGKPEPGLTPNPDNA